ncbi:YheV family putative zinc ribbon protein [Photobacterium sp. TY1-4]|uniref:YheV family putative zinc ribbon protein n=1 Tax=Photobacterium sp. TY1-4 TaxID=2899122 RepID=UPI0021C1A946|nr:YheV family putative zinc ribbon protein [Photobacterium sp. TY1-4]UXI01531.1 YheV family putative metal-binding protein [Photobacterium sp. TY1-4]
MAKKRFIAGAVCPQCQQKDTLRWWQEHEMERVECVACDYSDSRAPQAVEASEQLSQQTKDQVIGIFKPE